MPDDTTPYVSEGPARPDQARLTPEAVEHVLGEFRSWLSEVATQPGATNTDGRRPAAAAAIDLQSLLSQFVALRHEVNLQTRASRSQQEQNAETLRQLSQALEALHQIQDETEEKEAGPDEEAFRPLLKTLVDLYDSLALARREVLRVEDSLLPALEELSDLPTELVSPAPEPQPAETPPVALAPPPETPKPPEPPPSFWSRIFHWGHSPAPTPDPAPLPPPAPVPAVPLSDPVEEWSVQVDGVVERIGQLVTSMVTGYTMSVQRVERALQQFDLEPIPTVGQPFDPDLMEAIEVVVEPGRTVTEVVEEVRRGYLRFGRVFRFAQVRVAKPDPRAKTPPAPTGSNGDQSETA